MKSNNESFEETQRRVLGRPPTLSERLTMLRRNGRLLNVLFPSMFAAVVPMLILSDLLEERDLPLYVFVAIGAVVFLAVFLQMLFRETTARDS